jgi:demethylmenaquinone methyltransferase/2-methoxy-6-polyprenyl-1,4-benzoquinol methylase
VPAQSDSGNDCSEGGLGEDWYKVENALREIIPVYERTNHFISFGTDVKLRAEGVGMLLRAMSNQNRLRLVDLGCGPGGMSRILRDASSELADSLGQQDLLLVDAMYSMVKLARERNPGLDGLVAVYENLPLRGAEFDAALAGFAIRDARDLRVSMKEISNVLRNEGKFLIVDLSKPDSMSKRLLLGFYWRAIAPIIAVFASGRKGLHFGALATTFHHLPANKSYDRILSDSGFHILEKKVSMLGGVNVILVQKE